MPDICAVSMAFWSGINEKNRLNKNNLCSINVRKDRQHRSKGDMGFLFITLHNSLTKRGRTLCHISNKS